MPKDRTADGESLEQTEDGRIIQEAKDRFKRAYEWENDWRKLYINDVKFAEGDSDNGWQWPYELKRDRDVATKPSLTINKTKPLVLRVVNKVRKNPPSGKIKPIGGDATYEAAQAWEGLIRNIQYESHFSIIVTDACESQVDGGMGYWRVMHDYVDEMSFDQVVKYAPVQDTLGVLLDCDIKNKDGSDANWGFVWEDLSKDEVAKDYDVDLDEAMASSNVVTNQGDTWITTDKVRVAEYYRLRDVEDELIYIEGEDGTSATFKRSDIPGKWRDLLEKYEKNKSNLVKRRKIKSKKLQWFKIVGRHIVDRRDLAGSYIPLIRVPGREKRIDGKLERKGLVRTLKDPQRMYNYSSSGEVEVVALQTKSPYMIAAEAIEGHEGSWNDLNRKNPPYLTWKSLTSTGAQIPEPKRSDPPRESSAYIQGLQIAAAELEMASGMNSPQEQNPTIERSPRAIEERAMTAETAVFDFIYNVAMAIRHTMVVTLDLAPHVYDTDRLVKILDPGGDQRDVMVNPDAPKPYEEKQQGDKTEIIFNPTMGRYGVAVDTSSSYTSKREEGWDTMQEIFGKVPELINVFGDIALHMADFPEADKIAERIKKNIQANAPWLIDDNNLGPKFLQMQQENQSLTQQVTELVQKLAEKNLQIKGKAEMRDIDVHDANTRRLTAESNAVVDLLGTPVGAALMRSLAKTLSEMGDDSLQTVIDQNKDEVSGGANGASSVGAGSSTGGG